MKNKQKLVAITVSATLQFAQANEHFEIAPEYPSAKSPTKGRKPITITELQEILRVPNKNKTFHFLPGLYRLRTPITIKPKSSDILILGADDGQTIIDGTITLETNRPTKEELKEHPFNEELKNNLRNAKIPNTLLQTILKQQIVPAQDDRQKQSLDLYQNDRKLPQSRSPKKTYAVANQENSTASELSKQINIALEPETAYTIKGYPSEDWRFESHSRTPTGTDNSTNKEAQPVYRLGGRFFFENLYSSISEPGEWAVDYKAATAYILYNQQGRSQTVDLAYTKTLLEITDAQNVVVKNLTLQKTSGTTVIVQGSSNNIVLQNINVTYSGQSGMFLEGTNIQIDKAHVSNTNASGIKLFSGDRQTLEPGNSTIKNTVIENYGKKQKTYAPGIALEGVGNTIQNTEIKNSPHAAIIFGGNNHNIQNNDIHHAAQETNDVAAIYAGRDWTARGTRISANRIHDLPALPDAKNQLVAAIYLDDQASGITITGNILQEVPTGIMIGGGRDNTVHNNSICNAEIAIHLDNRGESWQAAMTKDKNSSLRSWLDKIPYQSSAYAKAYPNLKTVLTDDPGKPKYNLIYGNTTNAKIPLRQLGKWGDTNIYEAPTYLKECGEQSSD